MSTHNLTPLDLSVLKYYKEGNELCGFERPVPWENLEKIITWMVNQMGNVGVMVTMNVNNVFIIEKILKNTDKIILIVHMPIKYFYLLLNEKRSL